MGRRLLPAWARKAFGRPCETPRSGARRGSRRLSSATTAARSSVRPCGACRQTRPIDDLLVVDTGSRDGTAERVRSHLGPDAISPSGASSAGPSTSPSAIHGCQRRLAVAAPRRLGARARGTGQTSSAETEYTPNAGVLGPKLVGWDDPNQLQEVGWWIDRAAYATSPVEDREIDQGQHDHLSEVFFVSTAGMLVRRQALEVAGGFDPRMPAFRDDLDLCWRVHLLGGKVLVVPQARVRHSAPPRWAPGTSRGVSRNRTRYLIERHALAALLKATASAGCP